MGLIRSVHLAELDQKSSSVLLDTFNQIGSLLQRQIKSNEKFDSKSEYGENKDNGNNDEIVQFYRDNFSNMKIGEDEDVQNWDFNIRFKNKNLIDIESLYANLRLLPDSDIRKIRIFNRFIGQQYFNITVKEIFDYEERRDNTLKNPFFKSFFRQAKEFATLNSCDFVDVEWPEKVQSKEERDQLKDKLNILRQQFVELPGIQQGIEFFDRRDTSVFNAFFHVQRQFDSENWKDFDEEDQPYPQPLPRIAGYRKAIADVTSEFEEAEGSISMCFDYCRLDKNKVVSFIRGAEDTFLRIVNRLDDEYPLELDYAHTLLHNRAKEIKHMMFPLRCLFFQELEDARKVKDSVDNTLDSYLDMTLGKADIKIPPQYEHEFKIEEMDNELSEVIVCIVKSEPNKGEYHTIDLIKCIQKLEESENQAFGETLDKLSDQYEKQYKSDENNITRRLARLCFLYTKAFAQKSVMSQASQSRLDSIEDLANVYADRAEKFADVNIEDDKKIRTLTDDQLPMMASPEQMEDLYHTQKVVGRLAESESEFQDTAGNIEKGLKAAMDMMKKAEEFMQRMIEKMFPQKEDSRDLLDAIHKMIQLSYKTQQALVDSAKKEGLVKRNKNKKDEKELEKLNQEIEEYKQETKELQGHLQVVLKDKHDLVTKMRITQTEKDHYKNQLRMITVMTINSMQAQGSQPKA